MDYNSKIFLAYCYEDRDRVIKIYNVLISMKFNYIILDIILKNSDVSIDFKLMSNIQFENADYVFFFISRNFVDKYQYRQYGIHEEFKLMLIDIDNKPNKYILFYLDDIEKNMLPIKIQNRNYYNLVDLDENKLKMEFSLMLLILGINDLIQIKCVNFKIDYDKFKFDIKVMINIELNNQIWIKYPNDLLQNISKKYRGNEIQCEIFNLNEIDHIILKNLELNLNKYNKDYIIIIGMNYKNELFSKEYRINEIKYYDIISDKYLTIEDFYKKFKSY